MSEDEIKKARYGRWGNISYAQHADDLMLINIFEMLKIPRPSYLDLGAHHPFEISNTTLLYERGSRGVNVEANPSLIPLLNKYRPEDANVQTAVGLEEGETSLYMLGEFSGMNTISFEESKRYSDLHYNEKITVPVTTLNNIVNKYCDGKFPDILLTDIEGMDFEVLRTAQGLNAKIVVVETRPEESQRMIEMMHEKFYLPYCRMGENLFFVRVELRERLF